MAHGGGRGGGVADLCHAQEEESARQAPGQGQKQDEAGDPPHQVGVHREGTHYLHHMYR